MYCYSLIIIKLDCCVREILYYFLRDKKFGFDLKVMCNFWREKQKYLDPENQYGGIKLSDDNWVYVGRET